MKKHIRQLKKQALAVLLAIVAVSVFMPAQALAYGETLVFYSDDGLNRRVEIPNHIGDLSGLSIQILNRDFTGVSVHLVEHEGYVETSLPGVSGIGDGVLIPFGWVRNETPVRVGSVWIRTVMIDISRPGHSITAFSDANPMFQNRPRLIALNDSETKFHLHPGFNRIYYTFHEFGDDWLAEIDYAQWFSWSALVLTPGLADEFLETGVLRERKIDFEAFMMEVDDFTFVYVETQIPGLRELILAARGEGQANGQTETPTVAPTTPQPTPTPTPPTVPTENEVNVIFNGNPMTFDVPPQIINDRTMVPLRAIFEAMGAAVQWDRVLQTATATKGETTVVIQIGNLSPTINGTVVPIDQSAVLIGDRTLAPLRFVAEAFGGRVQWNPYTQTATITTN